MVGRRAKLTTERQRIICDVVRAGGTYAAAAARAGICESTLHDWRRYGDTEESGIHRDFVLALEQAEAEGEAMAVRAVFTAFTEPSVEMVVEELADGSVKTRTITRPPDATKALQWLERRVAKRWNLPNRLLHGQDPDTEPVSIYIPSNGRDEPPDER